MDFNIEEELSKIESNQTQKLQKSQKRLPYFKKEHFEENQAKKHTGRTEYVLLPQILNIDSLKKEKKLIPVRQGSPDKQSFKQVTYFAKTKSDPNLLSKGTLRKFDQLNQIDQTKTIRTFRNKKEQQDLVINPEMENVRELDNFNELIPATTRDPHFNQTIEQILEWNNGRNFTYLNWMPYNGSQINKDLRMMVDINAIDRINFAISEESLGYRRFEILIDKSLNELIDTQVHNENTLGRDNERNKKIVKKLDHLDSDLNLLYKYKPEAEQYFEELGKTVQVNSEHVAQNSHSESKGWTPIYNKDFRPMCMLRSKSTDLMSPKTLPMSNTGQRKQNVHEMYFNDYDKDTNKIQFKDTMKSILKLDQVTNTHLDVLITNKDKFDQYIKNTSKTQEALKKENNELSAKINRLQKDQKVIRKNIIISWRKKVDHLIDILKYARDPRETGICWAIVALWMLGVAINLKDINTQLDIHSRVFLINKAKLELVVSYTKFLTYKDNDFFGQETKSNLRDKSDSFIKGVAKKKLMSVRPEKQEQYRCDDNKAGLLDENDIDPETYLTKTSFIPSIFKTGYNNLINSKNFDNMIKKKQTLLDNLNLNEYKRIQQLFNSKKNMLDMRGVEELQTKVHSVLNSLFGFHVDKLYQTNVKKTDDFKQLMHQDQNKESDLQATEGKLQKMLPIQTPSATPDLMTATLQNLSQNSDVYTRTMDLRNKYQSGTLQVEVQQGQNLEDSNVNLHKGNVEQLNKKIINNTDQWEFQDLRNVGDEIN